MLRWLHRKLDRYYRSKDNRQLKKLIKKHVLEFKQKWPNCPIEVWKYNDEWFPRIGSWDIYKTEEYTDWCCDISDEYFDTGFCHVVWGCSSSIKEDDYKILD